ncbi:DUF1616 domain-containing protein [Natronosalvus rutilus]|uniref:DUF1616 domain-containing protein n=1 Tax=Natronosalvus rutilus TaxID=2953753 RepID=A0A9E7SY94_9EURY|nr:DUF1616 domain-containing protein [Natronosalvus rutilus]UTF54838.1 DUF1616 domain-containing protein [Natronosalvus rutilus]
MDARRSLWLLLPKQIRHLPADLAAMLVVTVLVNVAVFTPGLRETPLRVPLGLAFVLFVPGYVFIAALFPEAGESPTDSDAATEPGHDSEAQTESPSLGVVDTVRDGIDGIERIALSFGLSIAIVPLIGLVLNFTPWGIRLAPIMVAVTGFVLISTAVGAVRRWQLPAEERFAVPYRAWYQAGRTELLEPETRIDGALNVVLVLSILLAVGSVGFAVLVPPDGERFSAIYLLTEDDDGELVADDYPTELVEGESGELVFGVDNDEHRTVEYTVVVVEQRVETQGNETVVTEQRELSRHHQELAHNDSWHQPYELQPTMVGEDIRVVWLLFPDEAPTEPSMNDTEYTVHLWVDVAEADSGA